jgi:hypothetical protein
MLKKLGSQLPSCHTGRRERLTLAWWSFCLNSITKYFEILQDPCWSIMKRKDIWVINLSVSHSTKTQTEIDTENFGELIKCFVC